MMRKDRATLWEHGFPYDVLAEMGITPASTMQTVRDAEVNRLPKEKESKAAAKRALGEIKEIPKRLVVDFFLYQGRVRAQEEHNEA